MPKVLEDLENNLFIYIYTNEHIPAHVHVFKGRKKDKKQKKVKINIGSESERPSLVSEARGHEKQGYSKCTKANSG